ncbi:unnamed protein product [Blepharisma stoltei]|uniref:Uncharacterized protein n=1 Tax=Blepharisma stoltei TaxID=1481888 RepID=A0AAU9J476_9CILI|nr:unnamed protein product [Blepharisma stoltei]
MRVLIVNAFPETDEGNRGFSDFEKSVKESFSHQKFIPISHIEFATVDINTIDSYLYELNTKYLSPEAQKTFDHIDFVFLDGDLNLLPWYQKCKKFLILMRMCKRTKKVLFAAGCGMEILVFLCATKFHINRVINGQGKGSKVEDFQRIDKAVLANLKLGDAFLDNVTGDLYAYDFAANEFLPFSNIGLHHHKAAQENEKLRGFILKPYQYNPKQFDQLESAYVGKQNEALCRINKRNVQHWLVKNIGLQDFLIPQCNAWDIHPIALPDNDNRFQVFAETQRGSQLIIHHNAVGSMFHINPKYPQTVQVLKNFVEYMIEKIQKEKNRLDLPLSQVVYSILPAKPIFDMPNDSLYHLTAADASKSTSAIISRPFSGSTRPFTSGSTRPFTSGSNRPVSSSTLQITPDSFNKFSSPSRPVTASTVKFEASIHPNGKPNKNIRPKSSHSGFAVSKRHHEFAALENNATTDRPILIKNAFTQPVGSEIMIQGDSLVKTGTKSNWKLRGDFDKNESVKYLRNFYGIANKVSRETQEYKEEEQNYNINNENEFTKVIGKYEGDMESSQCSSVEPTIWKDKFQIRSMLHPEYNIDIMPKVMLRKNPSTDDLAKPSTIKIKTTKFPASRVKSETPNTLNVKSRTLKYPFLGSMRNDAPYKDPEKIEHEEQKESKKQWVSAKNITPTTAVPREFTKANPTTDLPYNPFSAHKFREQNKEKWLGGAFKVA